MNTQNTKCEYFISVLRRISTLIIILMLCGISGQASAYIHSAYGVKYSMSSMTWCAGNIYVYTAYFIPNSCDLDPEAHQYVPHSGNYKVKINFGSSSAISPVTVYFDATKPVRDQDVTVAGGSNVNFPDGHNSICYALVDESGVEYFLQLSSTISYCSGGGTTPLPPTPVQPPTSCKIHDGAPLTVDLKTIDRSALPTVPGTGSIKHFPVDVECTGGVDVSVSMKLSYTPITVSGTQVIQSSSNGLGVALIYNGKAISTTDATPVTFISGSNTLDLGFQAVRDPAVEVANIPTGAFTASAVLVMTQQ